MRFFAKMRHPLWRASILPRGCFDLAILLSSNVPTEVSLRIVPGVLIVEGRCGVAMLWDGGVLVSASARCGKESWRDGDRAISGLLGPHFRCQVEHVIREDVELTRLGCIPGASGRELARSINEAGS